MKTIKYYFIIIIATGLLGVVACTKDFLNPDIPDVDENAYFNNSDNAMLALTGCYDVMGWDDTNYFPFWLGDILGHDSYKGGEGAGDQAWIEPLLKFQYDANNEGLASPYKNYFIGIGRCNKVIHKVAQMSEDAITDSLKGLIIAQAKFIRSYFYFELVKTYGKVPLVTRPLKSNEYNQPLAEISTIYAQIEKDLTGAIDSLLEKSEYPATDMGRATKGAARAMLCKAYIYQQKWAQALAQAEDIIAPTTGTPEYSLEPNFADNWAYPHENGRESVFEIQFGTIPGGDQWGDGNDGNEFVIFCRSRNYQDGWGFNCPSQNLYDEFEATDIVRKKATFILNGEVLWPGTPDQVVANCDYSSNFDKMNTKKYQLPKSLQASNMSDDPNNWVVIRYAEVLLWASEAAYRSGGTGRTGRDWQSYLNEVRSRVGLGASPFADPVKAIFHERRVELAMEGHAFWDIIRSGRGVEVLGTYGYTEANHYLPIPQSQIDLLGL